MKQDNTVYWLWLAMVFGAGNEKVHVLLRSVESCKALYYNLHDPDQSGLTEKERQRVKRTTLTQAEGVMAACEQKGIGILTWESEIYPASLRHIYAPPIVLFYRGDPGILERQMMLTVVGTRHPSAYSLRVADTFCENLAKCNVILVSGCAVGLDAAAHKAAIRTGVPTIAVLGCGVDYDYPRENRALKEQIVQNGLLLSEYFPGTQPLPAHFPVRNRILSGLSEAVLVVEAGSRSGALITANLACEQGKSVFCVPPADVFDSRYAGVIPFLRDGAYPAFSYLDILYVFYIQYPHKLVLYDEMQASRTEDSLIFRQAHKKPASGGRRRAHAAAEEQGEQGEQRPAEIPEEATPEQRSILKLLEAGEQNVNAICCKLDMSFEQTSMLMMEMEMLGWIVNTERDMFALDL